MASRNLKFEGVGENFVEPVHAGLLASADYLSNSVRVSEGEFEKPVFIEGFAQRIFDTVLAGLILILLSPVFLFICGWILIRSGRPIFYSQKRIGMNGTPFSMFKFRTMVQNAHSMKDQLLHLNFMSGPFFKIKNDPRVTREGRLLRRWSLDELPQLLNVIRGEMSLVGPRPMLPEEIRSLHCRDILAVKPGMTGLWQVSGRNEILDFQKKLRLDRVYIKEKTLFLDCVLLWKTLKAVLNQRGAY